MIDREMGLRTPVKHDVPMFRIICVSEKFSKQQPQQQITIQLTKQPK